MRAEENVPDSERFVVLSKQVTQRGLDIVKVDVERNLLLIRGAVPGATGALLLIKKAGGGK